MIAVVIPLYNKESTISHCIESVLAQTKKPNQIIVVDDGSTDNGYFVASRYIEFGVTILRQKNDGESAARNRGVIEADSEYVTFLDADDCWLPNHLDELYKLISKFPNASIFSTSHFIFRNGEKYRAHSCFQDSWEGLVDNFLIQYGKCLSIINSSTACVKRDDLLLIGGFPVGVSRGPDVITWIKMGINFQMAHINTPTAIYNQEIDGRVSMQSLSEPPGSLMYLSELMCNLNINCNLKEGLNFLFDNISILTASAFYLNGDIIGAKKIAALAFSIKRYKTMLIIHLVMLTPRFALRLAKRVRHKRVS